jgi:nucleoid DNA-binding protein/DNA-directed RNA polymerase subunit RPC12/RpoP
MKKTTYTKNDLIRELAFNIGITQKKVRFVLEALQQIVYREAPNQGIAIPGICRVDVIERKARKMKNPQTGESILIAEHRTLRVRILKKARNAVTPPPENLISVLPSTPKVLDDFSHAVSFRCPACKQEIEAPLSAAGLLAECPSCGKQVTVPSTSEPGTLHGPALPSQPAVAQAATIAPPAAAPAAPAPAPALASVALPPPAIPVAQTAPAEPPPAERPRDDGATAQKNHTIRIDLAALGFDNSAAKPLPQKRMLSFFCKNCRQEIEAPADMAGTSSECPSCGISFEVPFFSDPGTLHGSDLEQKSPETLKEIKGRTIRIEVPDDV